MGHTHTFEAQAENVGLGGVVIPIIVPWNGWIRRVRAISGNGGDVTLAIRRYEAGTPIPPADQFDPFLAYSATTSPLDALECIHYEKPPDTNQRYYVVLWLEIAAQAQAPGTTVDVQLTIEAPGDLGGMGQGVM